MSRSSDPSERAQHSVAELLARYGEAAPSTGRRRRRAPEDSDTGPHSIIERIRTDTASIPVVARESTHSDPQDRQLGEFNSRDWTDDYLNNRGWDDRGSGAYRGSYVTGPDLREDTWMGLPPVGAGPEPLNGRALSSGPITDQFPRVDPLSQNPISARRVERQLRSVEPGEPVAGLGIATRPVPPSEVPHQEVPRQGWRVDEVPAPAQDDIPMPSVAPAFHGFPVPGATPVPTDVALPEEVDDGVPAFPEETDAEESTSAAREWVVMATQIGVGVVGGAVLWLICEWLWQQIPVVALVVALAVIAGLVWVVRRVRRTEDLQTTVIAVLVGLFVTVSPAALLLVGR
ncbi:MAG: hypothetical protein ACRDTC_25070 [Pseudonocardiaceae bacterium]